ncbi:polysaccharide deacetylase family protein [Paenibacillus donghaensis]|uniref:Polysaccharide deacetylase n=1 Tax=Paenibacillus donghaensis TaxID=414771 RepID=A0A2Z2K8Y7_9BACL|nr:polysaccharide deacetylase family protein [Paenibacillus donghaensis]ASA19805.1 hypothetical protein B9T62_02665 [Paenibacillus donghaensis]
MMKKKYNPGILALLIAMIMMPVLTVAANKSSAEAAQASGSNKVVALTFDDGPERKYTEQILDILKKNEIKATFFVIGRQVKMYPDVMQRISKEGHALGNHTWSHPYLTKISNKEIHTEISTTNQAIRDLTGITPVLMRPPYGATSAQVKKEIEAAGLVQALWNVDTLDWTGHSVSAILQIVKANPGSKLNVLMHSGGGNRENTVKALPEIIKYYKEQGYTFVTMPQLYNVKESNVSSTEPTEQSLNKAAIVTTDILNVRAGRGLEYSIISKLSSGTRVHIISSHGDWYQIKLPEGQIGWVDSSYLVIEQDSITDSTHNSINVPVNKEYYLIYNQEKIQFLDVKPYIDSNNRLQVPVRFITELLNFNVSFGISNAVKTIHLFKDNLNVELRVGDSIAVVNGKALEMDTSPTIVKGNSFVPIRVLGELVGMDLVWDSKLNTVTLSDRNESINNDMVSDSVSKTPILSAPTATVEQAKAWARAKGATEMFVDLSDLIWSEALKAGVDPVVVFCQFAKETGYGKFGSVLDETYMNPAGLKTIDGGSDYDQSAHQRFSNWNEGIQAHIDHLALYAGVDGYPKSVTFDPRHFPHLKGTAITVESLGGKWAPSLSYGVEIVKMMLELKMS